MCGGGGGGGGGEGGGGRATVVCIAQIISSISYSAIFF